MDKLDPNKERQKLVPVEMPKAGSKPPVPEMPENISEPTIKIALADIPDLSGKKVGDKGTLSIDYEIKTIDNDNTELQIINGKDITHEKKGKSKIGMSDKERMVSNLENNPEQG